MLRASGEVTSKQQAAVGAGESEHPRPAPRTAADAREIGLELYRWMSLARQLDRVEMELVNRGEAFFHVGGGGHESTAALARHLIADDYLHLHYRDKALMLARGVTPRDFLHGLVCTAESHSAGRQMSAHLSARHLNLMSLVGPVGNNALQAVGVARELEARHTDSRPAHALRALVVCAMGDGTTQQGEVLEAIAEASRARLPVLFMVADNGLAISTNTRGRTFYDSPGRTEDAFLGIPILRFDGRDALACDLGFGDAVNRVRRGDGPIVVVVTVERLTHHTNGDDERVYRTERTLTEVRKSADPIRALGAQLGRLAVSEASLLAIDQASERSIRALIDEVLASPNPTALADARPPWAGPTLSATAPVASGDKPATMLEAMRDVLREALANDPRVTLYGEDIEDPKGDVFGLTRGLSTAFPGRVENSALTESTIVGVSIGRALAGGRPIAFIQFADFLPLAYNQIASELASLWWRTNGTWTAPVVILAPCGGYRPGLGPFHAQSFEATFAHVPGLDVVMPSCADDAAGLLRGAIAGGRPTLFLYPKMLLNDASVATSQRGGELVRSGQARVCRQGDDVTLVSWGATLSLCLDAAAQLAEVGVESAVLDLRSQSPWDSESVLASVRRTGRLVVVHEDSHSGGFGAEIVATVAEHAGVPVQVRRVARPDTHIPCNYVNQLELLPSVGRILATVGELCGVSVTPRLECVDGSEAFVLEAVGSSPADQNVTVIEWRVREGESIVAGQTIAECEADKATFELCAPVAGVIGSLRSEGEVVKVGSELARIHARPGAGAVVRRVPRELKFDLRKSQPVETNARVHDVRSKHVGLSGISFVTGRVVVDNDTMAKRFPGRVAADIVQRTGIESRFHCADDEDVLTLATRAAKQALVDAGLTVNDLEAILVTSSTPLAITPSLACRLHHELSAGLHEAKDVQATDLLAACSGFLYALQSAHDLCQAKPDANVLVVSAEAMSRFVDPNDFDTAIVFGDAAAATVVRGSAHLASCAIRLERPHLSARGEDGSVLGLGRIEAANQAVVSPVAMNGVRVFPVAVRQMSAMLTRACSAAGYAVDELDWVVPHQANARILAAARQRAKIHESKMFSNVARYGNTSSASIPIALAEMVAQGHKGRVGVTAFGGGFTFGAAIMELD